MVNDRLRGEGHGEHPVTRVRESRAATSGRRTVKNFRQIFGRFDAIAR
jgi:hypothetical protein